MRTLCFVTRNANKLKEIQHILGDGIRLVTLADIGCIDPIPEPFETIHENSKAKALYVWEHYGVDCFADDSGLVIPALNGEPGVHSEQGLPSRYHRDRKSTRLNSSHVKISYAVFCLKKKNIDKNVLVYVTFI